MSHIFLHLKYSFKNDFSTPERLLSPILFSILVIILFSFGFEGISEEHSFRFFCAETYLILFFSIQLSFSRIFEPEQEDGAFALIRTKSASYNSWFLANFLNLFVNGFLILAPTATFSALIHLDDFIIFWPAFGFALLAMVGLSSLGVLLSAVLAKSPAKQILYPLIYFPLSVPVLLAGMNGTFALADLSAPTDDYISSWLILLTSFDVIYFTLSLLLFSEIVQTSEIETCLGED